MIRPEGGKVVAEERFERRNNMEITSLEKRTQVLVAIVFMMLSGMGVRFWQSFSTLGSELKAQDIQIGALLVSMTKVHEHVELHKIEKEIWIQRILDNVSELHEVRKDLAKFRTDVSARKDPFSGTQGRFWRELIDANLKSIYEMKQCCKME